MSWRALWAELQIPSGADQTPAGRLGTAAAHGLLGQVLVGVMLAGGLPLPLAVLAVFAAYGVVKEVADIRRGGDPADSMIDTAFVAFGGAVGGQAWGAAALLALAAADGAWGKRLRGDE